MADVDVTITNNTSSKQFLFRGVQPLKDAKTQNVTSIDLVNTTPANNLIFRFSGQTEDIDFTFAIFDDGVDVSNGTEGGGVTTVNEQIVYLRDTIFSDDFDDSWTLTQVRYHSGGVTGAITNITFDNPAGGVTLVTGRLVFKRGRLASF